MRMGDRMRACVCVFPVSIQDVQKHLQCVDHMKVYAKTDLPKRHHYVHNDRIDDIILDPAINWTVSE